VSRVRPTSRAPLPLQVAALLLGLAAHLSSGQALARSGGIAVGGCTGCHNGGGQGSLNLKSSPATFNPGDRVELTLDIVGGFANGGVYVTAEDVGDLQTIANMGLTKVASGMVQNQPKPASGGAVQFKFAWVAPSEPGAVRFSVYALGGNGNRASSGDTPLGGQFDFAFGCAGKKFYLDGDSDGFGREDFSMLGCADAPPLAYVETVGDCDDYRKTTFPGANELCNMVDDDCDGRIDEDAVPVELWPDGDGDGYYDARTEKTGEPKIGCAGLKGWAAEPGDCQPANKAVNPGVEEVCNNLDDDCDGDADERVRPTCGEGWCRRESPGCDLSSCTPGEPVAELCNFLDDDCDGEVDEGPNLCPPDQTCAAGTCVDSDQVVLDPDGKPMPSGGSGNASGSTGSPGAAGSSSAGSGGSAQPAAREAGCALGPRTSHGAFALLALLAGSALLRRERRSRPLVE
jgi:Putative metal-binding motif